MAELTSDVDHVAALMEQQRGETVAQVIRPGGRHSCLGGSPVEGSAAPGLIGRLAPGLTIAAWEDEGVVGWTAAAHLPFAEVDG